jgi:hypothetical protein
VIRAQSCWQAPGDHIDRTFKPFFMTKKSARGIVSKRGGRIAGPSSPAHKLTSDQRRNNPLHLVAATARKRQRLRGCYWKFSAIMIELWPMGPCAKRSASPFRDDVRLEFPKAGSCFRV